MTDAEAALVLARRWDDIERAMQDWYGDHEAVKEISDAFDCAIKLLQEQAAKDAYWAAMQAAHPLPWIGAPIPWPGTAAESNAAIRVSWSSGRPMTDRERQALLDQLSNMDWEDS